MRFGKALFLGLSGLSGLALAQQQNDDMTMSVPAIPEILDVNVTAPVVSPWAPLTEKPEAGDVTLEAMKFPKYRDGYLIFDVPPEFLNHASVLLDKLLQTVFDVDLLINVTIGSVPLKLNDQQARKFANEIREPLDTLHRIVTQATAAVRVVGLKFKTPGHHYYYDDDDYYYDDEDDEYYWDVKCDASCIVNKTATIVAEISGTAHHVLNHLGLKNAGDMVRPVIRATESLLIQLDGDLSSNADTTYCDCRRHRFKNRLRRLTFRVMACVFRRLFKFLFKEKGPYCVYEDCYDDCEYCPVCDDYY